MSKTGADYYADSTGVRRGGIGGIRGMEGSRSRAKDIGEFLGKMT